MWFSVAVTIAVVVAAIQTRTIRAQGIQGVKVDAASIGGVVLNSNGGTPEAGMWVIAETKSLPTPFRKIVVTDDKGRFVVPDLPAASYELWVRGFGLRDSSPVKTSRGEHVKLEVENAKDPQEAAKIYPANYWMSLYQPPSKEELPAGYTSQDHWIGEWKRGCNHCHQLGMTATRIWSTPAEWETMLNLNRGMSGELKVLGKEVLIKSLADWGSRIKAGEVPAAPPRPTGLERNVVVTQWDWGYDDSFIHDLISTDKRNPNLYPYGKVYGTDMGRGMLWELDPIKNAVISHPVPVRMDQGLNAHLDYYHQGIRPDNWHANPHNPMFDDKGRVWITTQIRPEAPSDYPKWARSVIGTETNSETEIDQANKLLEETRHHHQLGYFDTKTGNFVLIDTVFSTHHLQFDKEGRIWANSNSPSEPVSLGMFDTNKLDPNNVAGTEAQAQKAWMRIDQDTKKNVGGWGYGVAVSPVDGTVWQSDRESGGSLNKIFMFDPKTRKFKDYPLAAPGRVPHGIDASTDGKVWFSTGSGHLGRFDPKTEKFTYWELPGPKFKGVGKETGSTVFPYFLWVDQFDVLGLGKDTVFVCGTTADSLMVFDPRKETFSIFRVPYPLPFYTRGLDGRIDDPKAGWKGRGLWATYSSYMPRFTETKIGSISHIQLRPNPLAN